MGTLLSEVPAPGAEAPQNTVGLTESCPQKGISLT